MENNRNKNLVPVFRTPQDLDYNLDENLSPELNRSSAQRTLNSWAEGSLVDGIGQVWILADYLSEIWRTDRATASFFVGGIQEQDKRYFNDGDLSIKYSAVLYRLNEILQSPTSHKRREYLRTSEEIGKSVRDSDQVEVIRLRYSEFINSTKRALKQKRIRTYNISYDELTGFPLNQVTSEFHHIRRQSIYPELISFIWNGLVINKETHDILTGNDISDEYDLKEICEKSSWDLTWFDQFIENLG